MTTQGKIKFKNTPKKIYLIVGDDFGIEREIDFKQLFEVPWCEDRQYPDDIEYRLVESQQPEKTASAKEFLLRLMPSSANVNIEEIHTFSGEFLIYAMEEYAKQFNNKQ